MSTKPVLVYFPAAGRGELCRLIAAAGDVDMEETFPGPQYAKKVGWLGSMPVVIHGNFSICQSDACQKYLARISPKFKDLTAEQIAVDDMFAGAKEDMGQFAYPATSTQEPEIKKKAVDGYDRILGALEELVPADGFVHGLEYPTVADLVLINILEAAIPHAQASQNIGYDFGKFAKINANVERTKAVPNVANYL
jgi:glutathione S-transferase